MQGQEHLWEYYTRVALQRGVQAKRNRHHGRARYRSRRSLPEHLPRVTENCMNLLNKKAL